MTVDQHINLQGQFNGFRMSSSNIFLGEIRFSLAFMNFENKIIRPETTKKNDWSIGQQEDKETHIRSLIKINLLNSIKLNLN